MALSALQLNIKKHQEELSSEFQSDVYNRMLSFSQGNNKEGVSYTKLIQSNQHRRFLLSKQGDQAVQMRE